MYSHNAANNVSDERRKKDIQDADLGLEFINRLRPVSYYWKDGADTQLHYGLISQETEKVLKDVKGGDTENVIVTHDKESDRYGLRYTELFSPLIKAFQELYEMFLEHTSQIAELRAENEQMKSYFCGKDPSAPFCTAK